jgi:PAS domain S-box-containing protein
MSLDGLDTTRALQQTTDRKRAEAERLTVAIDQVAEMVVLTDAAGAIEYVNPAFESGTGYSRKEVLGKNPRLLKSGEHDAAFYQALWRTLGSGRTWRGRMRNRRKDGAIYTEEATISPVRSTAGAITGYLAFKRDITRDLGLEAQLRQAQKMESIGRLAGGVAHDFNNLLTVILSYVGLVLDEVPAGHPLREDILEIRRAGERAAALTGQLLALSRRQVLQPVRIDLNRLLEDMRKMLRRTIGEDIDLVQRPADTLGVVVADRSQLEQVIVNLVINARDAMPGGGKIIIETKDVDLEAGLAVQSQDVKPGPYVMLAVSDTGAGMDAQTRARVFEPFFTTKGTGKGTGLGLSTVYGIVTQSGGYISVYSEPGQGTSFKIYLPRVQGPSVDAGPTDTPPGTRARSETILVVEDEEALRRVIVKTLEAAGYPVLEASRGAAALEAQGRHPGPIHLVLTDVVMPQMNGRMLVDELVKHRPAVKVLYMSGYTDDAVVHHGVLERGTQFLSKPFTATDLLRKVREVLERRPSASIS